MQYSSWHKRSVRVGGRVLLASHSAPLTHLVSVPIPESHNCYSFINLTLWKDTYPSILFIFFKVVLATLDSFHFQYIFFSTFAICFRIILSISTKELAGIFECNCNKCTDHYCLLYIQNGFGPVKYFLLLYNHFWYLIAKNIKFILCGLFWGLLHN